MPGHDRQNTVLIPARHTATKDQVPSGGYLYGEPLDYEVPWG
jgi:hypothetical protein